MRPQAEKILAYLTKHGSDTDSNMSLILGVPAPSIRRSIQELIHEGYNVTYAGPSTGLYTFTK